VTMTVGVAVGEFGNAAVGVTVGVLVLLAVPAGVTVGVGVGVLVGDAVGVGAGVLHLPAVAAAIDKMSGSASGMLKISSSLISISPWIPIGVGNNLVPPIQRDVVLSSMPATGAKLPTGFPFGNGKTELPFK
jgi:hypothetical protein